MYPSLLLVVIAFLSWSGHAQPGSPGFRRPLNLGCHWGIAGGAAGSKFGAKVPGSVATLRPEARSTLLASFCCIWVAVAPSWSAIHISVLRMSPTLSHHMTAAPPH